jgi:hypothetical protein
MRTSIIHVHYSKGGRHAITGCMLLCLLVPPHAPPTLTHPRPPLSVTAPTTSLRHPPPTPTHQHRPDLTSIAMCLHCPHPLPAPTTGAQWLPLPRCATHLMSAPLIPTHRNPRTRQYELHCDALVAISPTSIIVSWLAL